MPSSALKERALSKEIATKIIRAHEERESLGESKVGKISERN